MAEKPKELKFSPQETQKRMEAALRGARITGHKPMSEITKRNLGKAAKKTKAKQGKPGK